MWKTQAGTGLRFNCGSAFTCLQGTLQPYINPTLTAHVQLSVQTQLKRAKQLQTKNVWSSPLHQTTGSASQTRAYRTAACLDQILLKTDASADSPPPRVRVKRSGWNTCRGNLRDPSACSGCSDSWNRPLCHKILTENRWRTSSCDVMKLQTQVQPFRSMERCVSTLI